MSESVSKEALEKGRLNHETAQIPWAELQRYFAAGSVLAVSQELDIIDVAYRMSVDDKVQIESWLKEQKIAQVSDSQAQGWFDSKAELWSVVVRPWVLVQDRH